MNNKKILITGAGIGIGYACTELFLKHGWSVVAHFHRSSQKLLSLQKKIGKSRLIIKRFDFGNQKEAEACIKLVKTLKLDALINNAAVYDLTKSSRKRINAIQQVMLVNVIVPSLLAEAALQVMKKQKKGHIINISSIAAEYGSRADHLFYGVSKRGLEAMSKSLSKEGAKHNVLVNCVRPGVTDTDFHRQIPRNLKKRAEHIPLKRMADAGEIAQFIYFLAENNTYITNEIMTIAGGE